MESSNSAKVALDTNMLAAIQKFGVDVFSELKSMLGRCEFVVPVQVMRELDKMREESKRNSMVVNVAKQAMEKNMVKTKSVKAENADSALLKLAKHGNIVATNDRILRKKIKGFSGRVIYLRKRKLVVME